MGAKQTTVAKTVGHILQGDPFAGLMVWMFAIPVFGLLCVECVVRQLQRFQTLKDEDAPKSPIISNKGLSIISFIESKHFALALEWAFKIGYVYMFFKLFTVG